MYTAIIWGLGRSYNRYINSIKMQELLGEIKILGVTDTQELYTCLDGYRFMAVNELNPDEVDFIIVTTEIYFWDVFNIAQELGFSEDSVIHTKVFTLPGFRFDKYAELVKSHVSIIANNCCGGFMYHSLGLPFRSPFINMFEDDADYIELLTDLRQNLEYKLKFKGYGYEPNLKRDYPICTLGGGIDLHFNHYLDMQEVEDQWYRRLERINWDNLFIMMWTESKETAQAFDNLNYPKKICFVPFECECKSAYTVQLARHLDIEFWDIVNKIAKRALQDYDLVDLLNTGRIDQNRYFLDT